jgi:hypothetical protein
MRKLFMLLFSVGTVFSCAKKDNIDSELTGKWRLIEVLVDPGDGSGTFHSVSSDKILEFHSDGTVSSTGSICDMSTESNNPSIGIYSLADSTIKSSNCDNSSIKIRFIMSGPSLIISYQCDEACQAKYLKI